MTRRAIYERKEEEKLHVRKINKNSALAIWLITLLYGLYIDIVFDVQVSISYYCDKLSLIHVIYGFSYNY